MFLDQYGIKHVTKDIFSQIVHLERTDFLFFISSAFIARFIELPEFAAYIRLTRGDFAENDSLHCHRVICDYYRSLIPNEVEYYIAPFSIKKGEECVRVNIRQPRFAGPSEIFRMRMGY